MPCHATRHVEPPSSVAYRPSSNVPDVDAVRVVRIDGHALRGGDRQHRPAVVRPRAGQREADDLIAGHDEDAGALRHVPSGRSALARTPSGTARPPVGLRRRADRDRDPPGVGQHVVGPRAPDGDQLVANPARERQVRDPVAVEVAELAPADPEFDAAEPVWSGLHARPRPHGLCDLFSGCHGPQTRAAAPSSPDAIGPSTLVACPSAAASTS